MPVDTSMLMDTLSIVARNRNVMVTAQQSMKAGAIAGSAVVVGTMLGGPIGLVLGKLQNCLKIPLISGVNNFFLIYYINVCLHFLLTTPSHTFFYNMFATFLSILIYCDYFFGFHIYTRSNSSQIYLIFNIYHTS